VPLFAAEAKERQREHGWTAPGKKNTSRQSAVSVPDPDRHAREANAMAGAAVGVSGRKVGEAMQLQAKAPELFERVKVGQMGLFTEGVA